MLAVSRQAHGVFLAWLNHDSLGPPGLQADLATGQARLDLDELLVGQHIGIGPLQVPMDGLDLPGLGVPVPLPPDWLRIPLTWLRAAPLPALIGIALAAAAMLTLERPRPADAGRREHFHRRRLRRRPDGPDLLADVRRRVRAPAGHPGDDGPAGRPAADRHRPGAQPSPSGRCAAARVG